MPQGSNKSHVTLKIPRDLAAEMDKLIGKHGYRSRNEIAKDAIRRHVEKLTEEGRQLAKLLE